MTNEFIAYKKSLKKRDSLLFGIMLLSLLECLFLTISIIATTAAPPIGIIMLVGCFFFLKLIIRQGKKCREFGKQVKAFTNEYHPSINLMCDTTYCFIAPFNTQDTIAKITEVLGKIGVVKDVDPLHCIVLGKLQVDLHKMQKIVFYVEKSQSACRVRAVFKSMANDMWWDFFLQELFESSPGIDYGVSLAKGRPQLVAVLKMGDETEPVYYSKTTGGTSLGGFLLGGTLFGVAGAVVGGLSGKQRTVTHTNMVYADTLLVRIIFNNGRLWEGSVQKGSDLYNEIMVNM